MNCGRDTGEIVYPVLLWMMTTTAQIAVAIIRVSALATINSIVLLAGILFSIGKPTYLLGRYTSVPNSNRKEETVQAKGGTLKARFLSFLIFLSLLQKRLVTIVAIAFANAKPIAIVTKKYTSFANLSQTSYLSRLPSRIPEVLGGILCSP